MSRFFPSFPNQRLLPQVSWQKREVIGLGQGGSIGRMKMPNIAGPKIRATLASPAGPWGNGVTRSPRLRRASRVAAAFRS